jgi:hypothetical protein
MPLKNKSLLVEIIEIPSTLLSSPTPPKSCRPDRVRATGGSEGEWKDPDTVFRTMPHQGILTGQFHLRLLR